MSARWRGTVWKELTPEPSTLYLRVVDSNTTAVFRVLSWTEDPTQFP